MNEEYLTGVIGEIESFRNDCGLFPPYALDSLVLRRVSNDAAGLLAKMVEKGVVVAHRTVNGQSYEIRK